MFTNTYIYNQRNEFKIINNTIIPKNVYSLLFAYFLVVFDFCMHSDRKTLIATKNKFEVFNHSTAAVQLY